MALFFAGVGRYVFNQGVISSVAGGVALTFLHWVCEVVHNLGHSTAARGTGHPMTGTRLGFWLVLGTSLYPPDEPPLPASIHIRRALGGPAGSAALTVVIGVLALLLANTAIAWILLWFLDNLLVFTIGAFVPVGFNDASTLIYWMRRR